MSYQETTSWFTRIKNALFGIIFGVVFFIGSFFLLVWNEKNSVETYNSLQEGQKVVITIPNDKVNPENNGKLVHLSGFATTDETLIDPIFNISAKALKLKRKVEMYQWQEEKKSEKHKNVGGSETTTYTYSYNKEWSTSPIESSKFKETTNHENPTTWKYSREQWQANEVKINDFILSKTQVSDLDDFQLLAVNTTTLPEDLKQDVKSQDSGYYIGSNPASPQIGDMKISYSIIVPQDVTIIAKQVNKTFEPFHAHAGGDINMIDTGIHSAQYMFEKAFERNNLMTWGIRLGGVLLMWLGLVLIFQLVSVVADVLPFLGSIVGFGIGLISAIIAVGLSFITIALAWIGFHPIVGVPLLIVGIIVLLGAFFFRRAKGEAGEKTVQSQTVQKKP